MHVPLRRHVRTLLALVCSATLAPLLLVPPAATAADAGVALGWPEVTAFNPDLVPYAVTVEDSVGGGVLVAAGTASWQVLDPHGTTALTFPESQAGEVRVLRCSTADESTALCSEVGRSPMLSVFRELVTGDDDEVIEIGVGLQTFTTQIRPQVPLADVGVTWELVMLRRSGAGEVVESGTAFDVVTREGAVDYSVRLASPPEPARKYTLRAEISATTTAYGRLSGTAYPLFMGRVDSDFPTLALRVPDRFHPVADGYQDTLVVEARTDSTGDDRLRVEVRDAAGEVVSRLRGREGHDGWDTFRWRGRDAAGLVLPRGRYAVVVSATDDVDNLTVRSASVLLSRRHRVVRTARTTVTAARSLAGEDVGRCSSLRKPGGGALVLESRTSCVGSAKAGTVVLTHAARVPRALEGEYLSVRVTLHGRAAGRGRSHHVVLGYVMGRDVNGTRVFRRGNLHPGVRIRAAGELESLVRDEDGPRPYLVWATGLGDGSRYAVRRFTVDVRYVALSR